MVVHGVAIAHMGMMRRGAVSMIVVVSEQIAFTA